MNHLLYKSHPLLKSSLSLDQHDTDMCKRRLILWELRITIVICSLQLLLSIVPFWYCLEKVTYRYQVGDTWGPIETTVMELSYYGLLTAHLNKWTIHHTWFSLKNGVCEQVSSVSLDDATCSTDCLHHLKTRCDVYSKVCFLSIATFGLLSIGCVLILFALRRFNKELVKKHFLDTTWWLGFSCLNVAILIQMFLVQNYLKKLSRTSLFPPVEFSFAFYLSCAVVLLLFLLKMISFLSQTNLKFFKRDPNLKNQLLEPYKNNLKEKNYSDRPTDKKNSFNASNVTHYQPPPNRTIPRPPMHFIY
ncbi:uncharacterized protein LOC128883224 isoform X3 [Hylaeus volcanicus]|uniref:uncharacterized protein LOC128883224 isoform X3 n=1 Tax=Hylaeus volcanicus TaxID=313075 RepID=UPI0023B7E40D|nr:uncharacterized protein LOC128883224 isoform X3 [Hylaeus volcanicus]